MKLFTAAVLAAIPLLAVALIAFGLLLIVQLPRLPSQRWGSSSQCAEELNALFPPGTNYKAVEAWVDKQPYTEWGTTPYDKDEGRGMVYARIYNGRGKPWVFADYLEASFFFDERGRITSIQTKYLRAAASHAVGG